MLLQLLIKAIISNAYYIFIQLSSNKYIILGSYLEDIELFSKYWDRRQFMHFMMGLREDFEPTRASLLSQSPTPSLDASVKELISEENR